MVGIKGGLGLTTSGGGGGGPPPVVIPAWDLVLRGEDVVYSGGLATDWANALGGPVNLQSLVLGAEPEEGGLVLNGKPSPLFPTRGALMNYDGTIVAGSFSTLTVEALITPDWDIGAGDRAYVFEYGNNTPSASQHIAMGIANIPGFFNYGAFYGAEWVAITDRPVARTVLITWVIEADGSLSIYRNGGLLQNCPAQVPSPLLTATYLGVGASTPNVVNPSAAFRGSMHSMRHRWGASFTAEQVKASYDLRMAEYNWPLSSWPAETQRFAGCVIENPRKRLGSSAVWYGAADLGQWESLTNNTQTNFLQGTAGFCPSDGARQNAQPTVDFDGTDDFMAAGALSNFISNVGFEYAIPFVLDDVSTAVAPATAAALPYNLNQLFADLAGFFWNGLNKNGGFIDIYPGMWSPGVSNAAIIGQYVLGTFALLHVTYDSTVAGGTLTSQLGAGPVQTVTGVGPITSLVNNTLIGAGLLAQPTRMNGRLGRLWTFTRKLTAANSLNLRNEISYLYNIPV